MMMPQFVLEDLTDGLSWTTKNCLIKTRRNETIFIEDATVFDDHREDDHFHFVRGAKTEKLLEIVNAHRNEGKRGVVMLRTMALLNGLNSILLAAGFELFQLYGEMSDRQRALEISAFRESVGGLLLMTRTTGGRGLDLPFADYAVFYSPKTDPVQMWQEMSRIRSTVSKPKDIIVLCYSGASEPGTLLGVVDELQAIGRHVTLNPPKL